MHLTDKREFPAEIAVRDPLSDIVLLKIESADLPVAVMGNSDNLYPGEWAIALGNPYGFIIKGAQPTVTVGVISATNRDFEPQGGKIYRNMIQTDAAINQGNSGGPLVNADGEVIGVNTFIISPTGTSIGLGFAIPINRVKFILREYKQYGEIRDIYLGMRIRKLDALTAYTLGIPPVNGIFVAAVARQSPAEEAGLQPGDVIVELNGEKVTNEYEFYYELYSAQIDETVTLKILRNGKFLNKEIRLEEEK